MGGRVEWLALLLVANTSYSCYCVTSYLRFSLIRLTFCFKLNNHQDILQLAE